MPVSNPPRRLRVAPGAAGRLDRSAALAEGIPGAFAGTVLDPADARLAGAFSARSESVLRTGSLPVPMQREISWWLAICQDNGERVVNANDWRRWAATAAEVAASGPDVRGPVICLFLQLTLQLSVLVSLPNSMNNAPTSRRSRFRQPNLPQDLFWRINRTPASGWSIQF